MTSAPTADVFGLIGTVIAGRYRVDSVVGEGGFGVVYRGLHQSMRAPIAIKCLRVPQGLDAAGRDRLLRLFLDEGRIMHDLSRVDAGIAQAHDIDVMVARNGYQIPYIILEWIEGRPLDEILEETFQRGREASANALIERLDPIARALGAAHERGIAHRDIKPSNIMFTNVMGRPTAKLLDFGIAKVMQVEGGLSDAVTTRGPSASSFAFTPRYAAPEQWIARFGATGPWTDVFAFALICVECLIARPALDGSDAAQIMGASIDPSVRPTPRAFGVDLGADAEAVFTRALAVNPAARYPNLNAFWTDLSGVLPMGLRSNRASRPSLLEGTVAAGPMSAPHGSWIPPYSPTQHVQIPISRGGSAHGTTSTPSIGTARSKAPTTLPERVLGVPTTVAIYAAAIATPTAAIVLALLLWLHDPSPAASAASGVVVHPVSTVAPVELSATASSLSIFCVPECDSVALDGRTMGPSPILRIAAPPGRHVVSAARDTMAAKSQDVVTVAGKPSTVRLWMDP